MQNSDLIHKLQLKCLICPWPRQGPAKADVCPSRPGGPEAHLAFLLWMHDNNSTEKLSPYLLMAIQKVLGLWIASSPHTVFSQSQALLAWEKKDLFVDMNIFFFREMRLLPLAFPEGSAFAMAGYPPLHRIKCSKFYVCPIQMLSLPAQVFPLRDVLKREQTLPLPNFALDLL